MSSFIYHSTKLKNMKSIIQPLNLTTLNFMSSLFRIEMFTLKCPRTTKFILFRRNLKSTHSVMCVLCVCLCVCVYAYVIFRIVLLCISLFITSLLKLFPFKILIFKCKKERQLSCESTLNISIFVDLSLKKRV